LALVAVAFAVLTWGWSNVAIKAVSVSGLVASFYRLWLAIPVLWLVVALVPGVRRGLDRDWLRASAVGGVLFGVHQLLFFSSLKLTSVANVSIIGALQPALVLLLAGPLFGERASGSAIAWSGVALAGTVVVVIGSHGAPGWSPLGDALAVANLFAFTTYFLFSKRARARVGTAQYVIGMTTVAGVVILLVCLVSRQDLASPHRGDWATLFGLAMVSGTLGHLLTNWAHPHASAFVISILLLGVPVLASGGAAFFLGETLGAAQLAGGAIVLVAIAVVVLSSRREIAEDLAESAAETDAP
jgi:drug/metabolite transporter (DMT)-like permease